MWNLIKRDDEVQKTESERPRRKELKGRFSKAMAQFRRKWSRRGIVEITKNHPRYLFTNCIRMGLKKSYESVTSGQGITQVDLTDEDFEYFDKFDQVDENKKKVEFHNYAPKVFHKLRNILNLNEDDYKDSLVTTKNVPYLEFLSNSKSGMSFFLCNNKMFMIKTEKPQDVIFFRRILKQYIEHFEKYPHTLMVKILGLHYIKIEGHKGKYFTVMQSVFYPDERILERYDLKGCEASRYTEPEPENSEIITVLKDKNLKGYQIDLGEQRQWFLDQVQYDTEFLEQIGVMDYSLLLGYHPIHFTERQQENQFAHVVVRVQKSVPLKRSEATIAKMLCDKCKEMRKDEKNKGRETSDEITGNELKDETTHDQTPTESPKTTAGNKFKQASKDAVMLPNMVPTTPEIARLHENRESTVELDQLKQKNMRLLLEKTNALNIIDGKNDRYFMGIIDFFTEYKAKKKAEHIYKSIRYPTSSFSTVSPSKYARRFRKFMEDNSK